MFSLDKIEEVANKPVEIIYKGQEDDSDPAVFTFNPMTPKEISAIVKKNTKEEFKKNQRIDTIDDEATLHEVLDKALVDWRGMYIEGDVVLECSKENKVKIFETAADISEWITDRIQELMRTGERSKELQEKNSEAS